MVGTCTAKDGREIVNCFRDVRLAFRRDDGRESLSESRMQQQSKHAAFRLFVLRETLRFARAQHKRPLQFARNPVRLPNTNVYGRLFFPVQTSGNASNICRIRAERSPYQTPNPWITTRMKPA